MNRTMRSRAQEACRGRCGAGNANMAVMVGLLVFAVLFISGAWFLSGLGPGKSGHSERRPAGEHARLEADVAAMLSARMQIRAWPSQDAAELTADQEQVLREALQRVDAVSTQKNWMTNEELAVAEELEGLATSLLAAHLQAVSLRLEAEGDGHLSESRAEEGLQALKQALARQAEVNTSFPGNVHVDRKRAFLLERKMKEQQSEPLYQASVRSEQSGDQELAAGNWRVAHGHFQEAFSKQAEINEEHAESKRRDPLRLQALQVKMAHAEAYETVLGLDRELGLARTHSEQSRYLESAGVYREVADKMGVLQKENPDLVPVLASRMEVAVAAATAAAVQHFRGYFTGQLARMDRHLVAGQMDGALQLEAKLRGELLEMGRRYPGVVPHLAGEQVRLQFLEGRKAKAAAQQQYLRQQFAPVPGHAGWWMLRTEVTQELYTALMDVPSPSRNPGGNLPVESVSHGDAVAFAKRAGWLLGVPAQLPTRAHFDAAAGRPASPSEVPIGSAAGTVPVTSGAAGPGGFFHLWGNVSEWLAAEEGDAGGEACHAGGHFLDTAAALAQAPVRNTSVNDRNRLIGFRIVIFRQ